MKLNKILPTRTYQNTAENTKETDQFHLEITYEYQWKNPKSNNIKEIATVHSRKIQHGKVDLFLQKCK